MESSEDRREAVFRFHESRYVAQLALCSLSCRNLLPRPAAETCGIFSAKANVQDVLVGVNYKFRARSSSPELTKPRASARGFCIHGEANFRQRTIRQID
jgi:hypothetical protein